jgi:8-oxo-dGTP diphosphatase
LSGSENMKTFYVGVKGVIIKGGKVLIVKATDKDGIWEVPGGRIEDNETIEQALRRELKEELPNIQNVRVDQILDASRLHKDITGDVSLVLVFYKVTAGFMGEPHLSDEHTEYRRATKDEALQLTHQSNHQAILRAFATVK